MILETLNTWGGKVFDALLQHIKKQSHSVDIFCFQEVYHTSANDESIVKLQGQKNAQIFSNGIASRVDVHKNIKEQLHEFNTYLDHAQEFKGMYNGKEESHFFGQMIAVKQAIHVEKQGDFFVYNDRDTWVEGDHTSLGRNLQYIQFNYNGKQFTIANLHGLWTGAGKGDTPERLEQSRKIMAFFNRMEGAKILCGDFNLSPETESMKILEHGMRNLIKDYDITSTRSYLYEKPNKFADYILVSPEVKVNDFQVLPDVVSDHLPLVLDFE